MTMPAGYDLWKTRSPDDERRDRCAFECDRCEDEGCFECCPPQPVELEDLDEIDADVFASDRAAELKARFAKLHTDTMAALEHAP